ncbi:hypothetical protein L0666_15115 [Octadecabacter sp. CECT 8868]|uniref:hypothetical protein n=1 Tax=Octadecabacter algicola TaxID=2909342 RepID=UPI001F1FD44D|nr:hypothetical protein [Octadecabacter algicola]MCF2906321.1 hypothetical protein [Octadecabacter algicola]
MGHIFDLTSSQGFNQTMYWVGLVAMFLAFSVALVGLANYVPGGKDESQEDNWSMLFATWRDSLIVTLLYTSQSFLWHFSAFSNLTQIQSEAVFLYAPLVVPTLGFIVDVLIFVIVAMRILALSRWISRRGKAD